MGPGASTQLDRLARKYPGSSRHYRLESLSKLSEGTGTAQRTPEDSDLLLKDTNGGDGRNLGRDEDGGVQLQSQ